MSRKHFRTLADQLKAVRPSREHMVAYAQWLATVEAVALACRAHNPRFQEQIFLQACEK